MTFKDFKEIYADESPIKLLNALIENVDYYADDMVAVAEAKHNRNEKDADYWRGEVRSMVERISWLRCKIERALKAQEPRVIQFDEIDDYEVLWLEVRDVETEDGLAPWIKTASGRWFSPLFCSETCPDMILSTPREYGKTCRCWTSRPTDEQREATPWE